MHLPRRIMLLIYLVKSFDLVTLKWTDIFIKFNVVQVFLFLNPYMSEFSDPQKPKNGQIHSSSSYKNAAS